MTDTEINIAAGSGCPATHCSASLKMSKQVPARIKTLTASWCHKDFLAMSTEYRAIRAKMGKPMDTCHWCRHKFSDGEMMALAAVHGSGNKVLCQSCADELLESQPNSVRWIEALVNGDNADELINELKGETND